MFPGKVFFGIIEYRYLLFIMTHKNREQLNVLSGIIIDCAISVHREMGAGLLEAVYHHCLIEELLSRNIQTQTSVSVPLVYKSKPLNKDYVIDLLVEGEIIVELKSVEIILPVHCAQLLSYLRLTDKRLGLLINFNVPLLVQGVRRVVNKF